MSPLKPHAGRQDEGLLSALAHELKTPLGVIAGYAELLSLRDDPKIRQEAPARIAEAAARLDAVADDLIALLESEPELVRRLLASRGSPTSPNHVERETSGGSPLETPRPDPAARRILVVDDDEEVRELLRTTLPTDDFEILEAHDGREALALVGREPPDLVLLDWNMPGGSGAEVLGELRSRPLAPSVIVLTAGADNRRAAESLGAEVFLTKPFSPLELLSEIERLLA